jgi:hypothetical protein
MPCANGPLYHVRKPIRIYRKGKDTESGCAKGGQKGRGAAAIRSSFRTFRFGVTGAILAQATI